MDAVSEPLLPGTFNSRDLGGLRADGGVTRSGVILRSDAPVRLGTDGRDALRALGVRTALDLREPVEWQRDPADLEGLQITVENRPIIGPDLQPHRNGTLEQIYFHLLRHRARHLAAAVAVLGAPEATPALVFCSAGKDRTGLVVALVLAAVGVRDAEILADYHRTERNLHGPFRAAIVERAVAAGITEQELATKVGAPPELMARVLEWLREQHGGAVNYLRANGLGGAELAVLRDRLLDFASALRCA